MYYSLGALSGVSESEVEMKELIKSVAIRSLGISLMSFIPGMGIGAAAANGNWFVGGIIATGTAFATVILYLGVVLTWSGTITAKDIETAFRSAAAKSAESNDDVKEALEEHTTNKPVK
jgi:hypothetical protein